MPLLFHPVRNSVIVWFREDLRLADNPALKAAADSGDALLPVYVLDDDPAQKWRPGAASRWWLHHSLRALAAALRSASVADSGASPLILRRGAPGVVLRELCAQTGARRVFWTRRYEPWARSQDAQVKAILSEAGIETRSFGGTLLAEPESLRPASGDSYRVFTPFWNRLAAERVAPPLPSPRALAFPARPPPSDQLDEWSLLPKLDWAAGLAANWEPGELGAMKRLNEFITAAFDDYRSERDRPDVAATSRLSAHLRFGEISARQVWHAVQSRTGNSARELIGGSFLRELGWREFAYHLLHHHPDIPQRPLRREFEHFPWREDAHALDLWQRGRTGFPIVDAGMRQLWSTGWMHNRVRMIAASFLVKDLLLPWQRGAEWFWDTLVDADLANNSVNWQWVAGCGADAAPYFRIFNPTVQSRRFDPEGAYIRRWIPELEAVPTIHVHAPCEAPPEVLQRAGVVLGETYPKPIVDHAAARGRALAAYQQLRSHASDSRGY